MYFIGLMGVHVDDDTAALDVCDSYLRPLGAVVTAAREVPAVFECHSKRDGRSNPQD